MKKGRKHHDLIFYAMKFSLVQMLLALLLAFNIYAKEGSGQAVLDRFVSVKIENAEVTKVLSLLKSQLGVKFVYSSKAIKANRTITANVVNQKLGDFLNEFFKPLNIGYSVVDYKVLLFAAEINGASLINVPDNLQVATFTVHGNIITGTVLDENGRPLAGATVSLKSNSKIATKSDASGNFKIDIPNETAILLISYVGFNTLEITATNKPIVAKLVVAQKENEEVVVVGYGTQKKINLTGAVGVASGERLDNRAISSAGEGLQGVIPNLNVTVRNGDPTASPTLNVRGYGSINGGSPLILVDGVPMDINRINPNDIKSISVLKDAAAGAVYGARAAFGVVLIETKKGQVGKLKVSFDNQVSLSKSIFNSEPETDPYQFILAQNTANSRNSATLMWDQDYIDGTKNFSEHPDTARQWKAVAGTLRFYGNNHYQEEVLTKFSPTNQSDLSISGGTDKAKFYASIGFLNKDGYLKVGNDKFKRYNVLVRGDFKINNWLSLDEKIVFNSQKSDKSHFYSADVGVNAISRVSTFQQIRFPDLDYYLAPGDRDRFSPYIGKYFFGVGALPYLNDGGRTTYTNNDLWLTQGITLTPLRGLKIRGDYTFNSYARVFQDVQSKVESINTNITGVMTTLGYSADDWIQNDNSNNTYSVLNAYAEYAVPNLGNHTVTTMVGFNQEYGYNSSVSSTNKGLITPNIADIGATIGAQQATGSKNEVALRGAFYRVTYDFKKKYLFEANGRYDGSSRFPKASRYGFFPSFSAAWRISNEKFMRNTKSWIDNLKIRASYGNLGNQLLGSNYYPYIPTLGVGTTSFMFNTSALSPTVTPAGLVSPTLTWETVTSQNIGLDFTLFKGRLDVSLDAYTRDTKKMLLNVSYPSILGTTAPKENGADLRTKGWEAAVTWKDKIKKNWYYDVTLALSDNQAIITKYNNPTGNYSTYYVGKNIGEIWGYRTVGIFQTAEDVTKAPLQTAIGSNWRPGDIQYMDLNNDGKIDAGGGTLSNRGDRTIIGNSAPRYSFGINSNVEYKNFRLSIFLQGVGKVNYMPADTRWNWFYPFQSGYVEKYFMKESWSETNRNAYFPAPEYLGTKNIAPQTRYLQNAAYVRLKNITLSYRLPEKLISRWAIDKVEFYASGMNLGEYSKIHAPLDPESIQTGAIEFPMQRIFSLGLNVSF